MGRRIVHLYSLICHVYIPSSNNNRLRQRFRRAGMNDKKRAAAAAQKKNLRLAVYVKQMLGQKPNIQTHTHTLYYIVNIDNSKQINL